MKREGEDAKAAMDGLIRDKVRENSPWKILLKYQVKVKLK